MIPHWDPLFKEWVVPTSCPVCQKCYRIVQGPRSGMCVYSPCSAKFLTGYEEVPDALVLDQR